MSLRVSDALWPTIKSKLILALVYLHRELPVETTSNLLMSLGAMPDSSYGVQKENLRGLLYTNFMNLNPRNAAAVSLD